jgi:hypothetical protein
VSQLELGVRIHVHEGWLLAIPVSKPARDIFNTMLTPHSAVGTALLAQPRYLFACWTRRVRLFYALNIS